MCVEVGCGTGFVVTSLALLLQVSRSDDVAEHRLFLTKTMFAAAFVLVRACRAHTQLALPLTSTLTLRAPRARLCPNMGCMMRRARMSYVGTLRSGTHCGSTQVVITDLVTALQRRLHNKVDVLVFNPPYVPSPSEEVIMKGALVVF